MLTCASPESQKKRACSTAEPVPPTLLLFPRPAPELPLLAATRLQLEWHSQEPSLPLNTLCRIILSDAGATIGLLRFAADECGIAQPLFARIEDCIAAMELRCWLDTIRQAPPAFGPVANLWRRARHLAQCAHGLAQRRAGVPPHLAYLGALLSVAADVPAVLGWDSASLGAGRTGWLTRLTALPLELTALLVQAEQPDTAWGRLLAEARRLIQSAERVA